MGCDLIKYVRRVFQLCSFAC